MRTCINAPVYTNNKKESAGEAEVFYRFLVIRDVFIRVLFVRNNYNRYVL